MNENIESKPRAILRSHFEVAETLSCNKILHHRSDEIYGVMNF